IRFNVSGNSTGKERDQESGNDYFGTRYYSSAIGRFMSRDPNWVLPKAIRPNAGGCRYLPTPAHNRDSKASEATQPPPLHSVLKNTTAFIGVETHFELCLCRLASMPQCDTIWEKRPEKAP